jgi:hypothetical protein
VVAHVRIDGKYIRATTGGCPYDIYWLNIYLTGLVSPGEKSAKADFSLGGAFAGSLY